MIALLLWVFRYTVATLIVLILFVPTCLYYAPGAVKNIADDMARAMRAVRSG